MIRAAAFCLRRAGRTYKMAPALQPDKPKLPKPTAGFVHARKLQLSTKPFSSPPTRDELEKTQKCAAPWTQDGGNCSHKAAPPGPLCVVPSAPTQYSRRDVRESGPSALKLARAHTRGCDDSQVGSKRQSRVHLPSQREHPLGAIRDL